MKKNIFILDDHEIIIHGLIEFLTKCYSNTFTFEFSRNVSDLIKSIKTKTIDLIILDYELKDSTALEVIPLIKQHNKKVSIIINTMHNEPWIISMLIKKEIDGIVLKNDNIEYFSIAIQEVLYNNQKYFSPSALHIIVAVLGDNSAKRLLKYSPTPRECEILNLLSQGLTSEEIAVRLYITKNTVDAMRKNILLKSGASNVSHLMRIAFLKGWIDE